MANDNRNEALDDALRELGTVSTPEELTASGVRRVRRVSREMVSRLIEMAVNRTLMERTIGVPEEELSALVERANTVFHRIVGRRDELDRTRERIGAQRVALGEELARLRSELTDAQASLQAPDARARADIEQDENDRLLASVRDCFGRLERIPPELRRVEREVCARALEVIESARASATIAGRAESSHRIDELERRIAKLVKSLQVTEQALDRVARFKREDDGLESIYRTVQGLDAGESDRATKLELMRAIFEKNVELHRRLSNEVLIPMPPPSSSSTASAAPAPAPSPTPQGS